MVGIISILHEGKLVILQSNDYIDVEEHVNCSKDIQMFSKSNHGTNTI